MILAIAHSLLQVGTDVIIHGVRMLTCTAALAAPVPG